MALKTKIEWTEATWNPITGCTKVSTGCENCYAERFSARLRAAKNPSYSNGFNVTVHRRLLELPLSWKKPQLIFVNSMSDLFHESVPEPLILEIFEIMKKANWHQFQVLTKRSKRMLEIAPRLDWVPNIWAGVSVENQHYSTRIDDLLKTSAKIKFVSFEPLLGPILLPNLDGIDWVVVGGESGPNARYIDGSWVRSLRDQCQFEEVPFFFKQWGGFNKKKSGRELDGRIWAGMPDILSQC